MIYITVAAAAAVMLVVLYRRGLLERNMLLLLLILDLTGGCLSIRDLLRDQNEPVTELPMEKLEQEGSVPMDVYTDNGEQYEVEIDAPERSWSEKEARQFVQEAAAGLEETILGANQSFQHISRNLNLPVEIGEAPVQVEWYSDQPEILGFDGEIQPGVPEKGVEVTLSADLLLQDQTENWQRKMTVYPSQEESSVREEIIYQSRELNKNPGTETAVYQLPEEAAGRKLKWKKTGESSGIILSVLALAGGLLGGLASREQEEKKRAARREELLQDYPELLSKIQLYLSTGLSMRSIFSRIAGEYQTRLQSGGKKRHAYEALLQTVHRMESGTTELEAYDFFGRICGVPCYRGLALLLAQNLKKGGAGVMPQLEREVQEAFQTRKRRARAEGEKTTVKLLLPMAMMLIVVMALILIPAFLSI